MIGGVKPLASVWSRGTAIRRPGRCNQESSRGRRKSDVDGSWSIVVAIGANGLKSKELRNESARCPRKGGGTIEMSDDVHILSIRLFKEWVPTEQQKQTKNVAAGMM